MSTRARTSACVVVLLLVASSAAVAHHSAAATYAADESIAVRGTVLAFAWTNPHCRVYIDVADGPFKGRTYTVELASPAALAGDGWTRTLLHPGDDVVMTVQPSRSGAPAGLCRRCTVTVNGKPMKSRPSKT